MFKTQTRTGGVAAGGAHAEIKGTQTHRTGMKEPECQYGQPEQPQDTVLGGLWQHAGPEKEPGGLEEGQTLNRKQICWAGVPSGHFHLLPS